MSRITLCALLQIEQELQQALEHGELRRYFHPGSPGHWADRQRRGAGALGSTPRLGADRSDRFLKVAEETG